MLAEEFYNYLIELDMFPEDRILVIVDFFMIDSEDETKVKNITEGLICQYHFEEDRKLIMSILDKDLLTFIIRLCDAYKDESAPFNIYTYG